MTAVLDALTVVLISAGCLFFFAGTVGLLRFPDFFTRLHAMTKADNVGLGLVVLGLAVQADGLATVGQLVVVWLLVLVSSASSAHLLAQSALSRGVRPWRAP